MSVDSWKKPHRGSIADERPTPSYVFEYYNNIFNFNLDVAATPRNHKTRHYFTKINNGLEQPWHGVVWCNPPYSKLSDWIRKCYEEVKNNNCTIVALVPDYTVNHKCFLECCQDCEIHFIAGRIRFDGQKHLAPFGNLAIIWRPGAVGQTCKTVEIPKPKIVAAAKPLRQAGQSAGSPLPKKIKQSPTVPLAPATPVIMTIADIMKMENCTASQARKIQDKQILAFAG